MKIEEIKENWFVVLLVFIIWIVFLLDFLTPKEDRMLSWAKIDCNLLKDVNQKLSTTKLRDLDLITELETIIYEVNEREIIRRSNWINYDCPYYDEDSISKIYNQNIKIWNHIIEKKDIENKYTNKSLELKIENKKECESWFYNINNECKSYGDYNKDLIYIDKNTLLMWQVIPQYSDSWYSAESIASSDTLLWYDDWRLPDSKEIRTIYNCSWFKCTPKNVINNKYKGYWTSSNRDINFYWSEWKMFFKSDEWTYPWMYMNTWWAVRLVRNIK